MGIFYKKWKIIASIIGLQTEKVPYDCACSLVFPVN